MAYPFQLIRLGAYWNRIEPEPGVFDTRELDLQVEMADRAGKEVVLCVGPLKTTVSTASRIATHFLKIFAFHRWKYLEFSKEPLNIRYDEPGRHRELSWQKEPDRLNKCST